MGTHNFQNETWGSQHNPMQRRGNQPPQPPPTPMAMPGWPGGNGQVSSPQQRGPRTGPIGPSMPGPGMPPQRQQPQPGAGMPSAWRHAGGGPVTEPPFLYQPSYNPTGPLGPNMGGPGSRPVWPETPPPHARAPYASRPNTNRIALIVLIICAVLIGGTSILGFLFVKDTPAGQSPRTSTTPGSTSQPGGTPLTEDQRQQFQQLAAQYVEQMTLDEQIAQLVFVDNRSFTNQADLDFMVENMGIGGILMYYDRLNTLEQVNSDTEKWQGASKFPLFIATEDEGGYVERLTSIYPERPPSAHKIGQSGDPNLASAEGEKMAGYLKELGLNTSFTPVVDVGVKDGYMDWDERSFGKTAEQVIKYAGPYLAGLQKQGIVGSVKHFPGIGRIQRGDDPHGTLPTLTVSREQFYKTDMAVFKHFANPQDSYERPGFVMMTYVMVPSIDPDYSAQYSKIFIQDILRKEFGYDGVIITDALVMQGSQIDGIPLTLDEAAVAALKAGNDMLLGATSSDQVQVSIDAVKAAIDDGELTAERIKESVVRVLTLKMERGLMPAQPPQG